MLPWVAEAACVSNKLKSYLGCAAWDRGRARAGLRVARPKLKRQLEVELRVAFRRDLRCIIVCVSKAMEKLRSWCGVA